jgi:hypothetical protein
MPPLELELQARNHGAASRASALTRRGNREGTTIKPWNGHARCRTDRIANAHSTRRSRRLHFRR